MDEIDVLEDEDQSVEIKEQKEIKDMERSISIDRRNVSLLKDVKFIRILWCDNANIIRGKAVYLNFPENLKYYVGISEAQQAIPVMYDGVILESGLSAVGEVYLMADMSSFTSIPYSPGHGRAMGDMIKNGKTWSNCPRGFLKKMIKEAAKMNISIKGAFENEFYLLKKRDEEISPVDNTPFASTYSMDLNKEVIGDIVDSLVDQNMEVQQYYPESGPGQQEITIGYAGAIRACDNQIAFRETVRAVASKHGLIASFLPKIFQNNPGNGCHLHLSLWNENKNILGDPENKYMISKGSSQFIAGILHHLPALMAITTPIPNSYRRIIPNSWSGAFQCWGIDNREAAIRIISEPDGIVKNFELKTLDASSNPYLAFGAVIAAGIDGIKNEMELEDPIQENPENLKKEDSIDYKIRRLPSKLDEAINELEKNKVILDAMGYELSKAYIAVKKTELEVLGNLKPNEEVELLLEKY
ncbi:glutamine synthetase family protein [Methanobacterium oryzae]|uniref:glutamine synthetase family protein n=1 Tax=Methanobacterium oryzae TaxID=69540 RepID=UPI003D1C0087